jgi:phosphatidylinositol alpha-mannosyltransferase
MNIAVVSYHFPPYDMIGSGMQMHVLANEYARKGHNVTVVSAAPTCPKDSLYKFVSAGIHGSTKLFRWFTYTQKIDWSTYDLVHAGGDGHLINASAKFVIRTLLGSSKEEARNQIKGYNKTRMYYLYLMELIGVKQADMVTCISPETQRDFSRELILVPCGIDLGTFQPGQSKSIHPSILFVGIVNSRKRGYLVVDAFEDQVLSKFPTATLNVVRDSLKLDNPSIRVHGSLPTAQLVRQYQENWLVVLPSSYEGFGLPYVEGMACGTPVMATPNPGARFVLDHGKFGMIVDEDMLGNAICNALNAPDVRSHYIEQGLLRAGEFSIKAIADSYLDMMS